MTNQSTTVSDTYFDICLLNSNHRKKELINRQKNLKIAQDTINRLSKELEMDIVKYNPIISSKSKSRKR